MACTALQVRNMLATYSQSISSGSSVLHEKLVYGLLACIAFSYDTSDAMPVQIAIPNNTIPVMFCKAPGPAVQASLHSLTMQQWLMPMQASFH